MNTIKHITAISIILYSFSFSIAQVPDWNLNDCEGVNTSMHSELAVGNAVILDFGAMW